MSAEAGPRTAGRTLADYVRELVLRLGTGEPRSLDRMREVVGSLRARVGLDEQTVDVAFVKGVLDVAPATGSAPVDGEGWTDSATVLDLLDGRLEVTDSILDGRLQVRGPVEHLVRMFQALEIFLDASTRVPPLRELAEELRRERDGGPTGRRASPPPPARRSDFAPTPPSAAAVGLLRRLDLLP